MSDNDTTRSREIVIDPAKEGVQNRVSAGSVFQGDLDCAAGLWVDGKIVGNVVVHGVLVLAPTGEICGDVRVRGPRAVLAGRITPRADGHIPQVVIEGVAHMAHSLNATADFTAVDIDWHHGATIEGKVRSGNFDVERAAAA